MKSCLYFSFCCVCLFSWSCLSSSAFAVPKIINIDGDLINEQRLTITGSGFGVKLPAEPVLWDNFESGVVNPGWTSLGVQWEIYSGVGQITGSKFALRGDRSLTSSIQMMKAHGPMTKEYTFVKRRWDFDLSTRNQKFYRLYQSQNYSSIGWNYLDGNKYHMRGSGLDAPSFQENTLPVQFIVLDQFPKVGVWQTDEFFFGNETGIGACDAVTAYRKDNNQHRSWAANRCVIDANHNFPFTKTYIDNYGECEGGGHDCLQAGSYIWVDDVYIDNTWARVVIGNASSYDSCTNIEIQPPVSWDNDRGEIVITLNQGAFSSLQGKYLFVFDADNQPSGGFLLDSSEPISQIPLPLQGFAAEK